MRNSRIKAAIFDFDDTLVDTQGFFFHHLHMTLVSMYGIDYHSAWMATAKKCYYENLPFEAIFNETFGESSVDIISKYRQVTADAIIEARRGMLAFVKDLAGQDLRLSILSNRTRMLTHRLKQAGYELDWFEIYQAKKWKPHFSAYDEVLQDLENEGIAAAEILIIGNHPDDYSALPEKYKMASTFIAFPIDEKAKHAFLTIIEKENQNIEIYEDITELRHHYGRIY